MKRHRLLFLALAVATMTGCTTDDRDDFFLFVVLFCFGALASVGALVGSGFALAFAVQQKPRGYINLVLAIPCAVAALALDIFAVTFSTSQIGVDRHDYFLMAMTATPFCWLAATVIGVSLRPPAPTRFAAESAYRGAVHEMQPPVPMTANRIVQGIVPSLVVLVLYFIGLYFALPIHVAPVTP